MKALLDLIWPAASDDWIDAMADAMAQWGIDKDLRVWHFCAQIGHESLGLTKFEESLYYRAERLMAVWPKRFPTLASTAGYAKNPQALANLVYANRMGNGPPASGDGWRYRGRGPIQITGRANYGAAAARTGMPLLGHPDLALEPVGGSTLACWYWVSRNLNTLADKDDIVAITKAINGGKIGLEHRRAELDRIRRIVGAQCKMPA